MLEKIYQLCLEEMRSCENIIRIEKHPEILREVKYENVNWIALKIQIDSIGIGDLRRMADHMRKYHADQIFSRADYLIEKLRRIQMQLVCRLPDNYEIWHKVPEPIEVTEEKKEFELAQAKLGKLNLCAMELNEFKNEMIVTHE